MQTLMRLEAGPGEIRAVLDRVAPELASDDGAAQVHERLRRLAGHWKATPHGGEIVVSWTAEAGVSSQQGLPESRPGRRLEAPPTRGGAVR